jgi:hypothetical protein
MLARDGEYQRRQAAEDVSFSKIVAFFPTSCVKRCSRDGLVKQRAGVLNLAKRFDLVLKP